MVPPAIDKLQLLGVCMAFGRARGFQLYTFTEEWAVMVEAHGESIGIEDFARWSRLSRATAYRRLAHFRAAFPMLGPDATPEALMGPLLERLAAEAERK